MSPDAELLVIFGVLHLVALVLGGALFLMFLRSDGASNWTPEDEDDDTSRPLHVIKIVDYSYHPFFEEAQTKDSIKEEPTIAFTGYIEHKPTAGFTNILLPPPKQVKA